MFGGNFRQHLGDTQPDRNRDAQFAFDFLFHLQYNFLVGGTQQSSHAGKIGKRLIDGIFFHVRRETPHDVEHPLRKQAVGFVV